MHEMFTFDLCQSDIDGQLNPGNAPFNECFLNCDFRQSRHLIGGVDNSLVGANITEHFGQVDFLEIAGTSFSVGHLSSDGNDAPPFSLGVVKPVN